MHTQLAFLNPGPSVAPWTADVAQAGLPGPRPAWENGTETLLTGRAAAPSDDYRETGQRVLPTQAPSSSWTWETAWGDEPRAQTSWQTRDW